MSKFESSKCIPAPDPELICAICMNILDRPLETRCRHVFCSLCIKQALKESSKCPVCRSRCPESEIRGVVPLIQNMLNKLSMKCDNFGNGCTDLIPLEFFLDHEKSCPFELTDCKHKDCVSKVLRQHLVQHERTDCIYRLQVCEKENGCGLEVLWLERDAHNCMQTIRNHMNALKDENGTLRKLVADMESVKALQDKDRISLHKDRYSLLSQLLSDTDSDLERSHPSFRSDSQSRSNSFSEHSYISLSVGQSNSGSTVNSVSPVQSVRSGSASPIQSPPGIATVSDRSHAGSPPADRLFSPRPILSAFIGETDESYGPPVSRLDQAVSSDRSKVEGNHSTVTKQLFGTVDRISQDQEPQSSSLTAVSGLRQHHVTDWIQFLPGTSYLQQHLSSTYCDKRSHSQSEGNASAYPHTSETKRIRLGESLNSDVLIEETQQDETDTGDARISTIHSDHMLNEQQLHLDRLPSDIDQACARGDIVNEATITVVTEGVITPVRRSARLQRQTVEVTSVIQNVDVPLTAAFLLDKYVSENDSSDDNTWSPPGDQLEDSDDEEGWA